MTRSAFVDERCAKHGVYPVILPAHAARERARGYGAARDACAMKIMRRDKMSMLLLIRDIR